MTDRKAFAESIRPAVRGQSDKYSWRLYQRALKNGRESVFLMAWNSIYGLIDPDPEQLKADWVSAMGLAIGRRSKDNWFHGNTLGSICRPGGPRHDWAYGANFGVKDWIDITDWFWATYQRDGMCRFFRNEHKWSQINRNSRKCAYCGKHERRTIVTRKSIKRIEEWK